MGRAEAAGSPVELWSRSEADTLRLGAALAAALRPGDVVLLAGPFGAGKTALVRGVADALGAGEEVASPSFALIHEYALPGGRPLRRLYHMDLYRIVRPEDAANLGLDDYLDDARAATMVEWPEVARPLLPADALLIEIKPAGEERRLRASPGGERSATLLRDWLVAAEAAGPEGAASQMTAGQPGSGAVAT